MKLNEYLKTKKLSAKDFAKMIGVTEMSVHRYRKNLSVPATMIMSKIIQVTGNKVGFADFIGEQQPVNK
jgi:predicted transcriptional regulator